MLGKLIKYDIRSTWRDFAGVYLAILLGVLVLPPFLDPFQHNIIRTIATSLAIGIVVATVVTTVVTLFKIYNANVFSKAGYLTMTLPATSAQIVVSKLLVSTMWIVFTGIVSVIGLCIFSLNINGSSLSFMAKAFQELSTVLDSRGVLSIILVAFAMLLSMVKEISKLFLACTVAHLKQVGRFRVVLGIFTYFILSWLEVRIVQAVGFIVNSLPGAAEYVRQLKLMSGADNIHQFVGLFNGVMGIGILYALALIALYSTATVWLLNHKLDLD